MRNLFYIFCLGILLVPSLSFAEALSSTELLQKYNLTKNGGEKVRVLIVPGHNNESWGTEHLGTKEVELNRVVANELFALFSAESSFETFITQKDGEYTSVFSEYFASHRKAIHKFRDSHIALMTKALKKGTVEKTEGVPHNTASEEVSTTLYGINKWANENDIDLLIHVHFNDYGGRPYNQEGEYNGFTVYVPEAQLNNSEVTLPIAQKVFARMQRFNAVSNLPGEEKGVTPDQDLIAIGSHNTVDAASMLIEYGYIYEPQFVASEIQTVALKDAAYQTYLGVKDFFNGTAPSSKIGSSLLPYSFKSEIKKGMKESLHVFALQTALAQEGIYPGKGKTLNDCPISGNFGPCTESAVKVFQRKHKLPETGLVGAMTRKVLNLTYGK